MKISQLSAGGSGLFQAAICRRMIAIAALMGRAKS
jgi:hypothetical protein